MRARGPALIAAAVVAVLVAAAVVGIVWVNDDEQLLVVAADDVEAEPVIADGARLRVTGTVRTFDQAFEVDTSEDLERFEGELVLVAEDIRRAKGPAAGARPIEEVTGDRTLVGRRVTVVGEVDDRPGFRSFTLEED